MTGSLFRQGDYTLRSGEMSHWKIECDALSADDWAGLAAMAVALLPPFGVVEGVPRGGVPFANALRAYSKACSVSYQHPPHDWCLGTPLPLLIAEDVCTTGGSMERFRAGREAIGVCAFARGTPPAWVTPVLILNRPGAAGV